jgi:hypothetical protein
MVEEDYLDMAGSAGVSDINVLRRFDYFEGSPSADTRRISASLGAHAIEFVMPRPD